MSERPKKILLVGHCRPDVYAMRAALGSVAPGSEFVVVNDDAGLEGAPEASAILVNRVLDGDFRFESGLELIRGLPEAARRRTLLISNFPEAQRAAVEAGAAPGFGKSEMYSDRARSTMLSLLGGVGAE